MKSQLNTAGTCLNSRRRSSPRRVSTRVAVALLVTGAALLVVSACTDKLSGDDNGAAAGASGSAAAGATQGGGGAGQAGSDARGDAGAAGIAEAGSGDGGTGSVESGGSAGEGQAGEGQAGEAGATGLADCNGVACPAGTECLAQTSCSCVHDIPGIYVVRADGKLLYEGATETPVLNAETGLPLEGVKDVQDAHYHGCATTTDGSIWCWRTHPQYGNVVGQLGSGVLDSNGALFRASRVLKAAGTPLSGVVALASGAVKCGMRHRLRGQVVLLGGPELAAERRSRGAELSLRSSGDQ